MSLGRAWAFLGVSLALGCGARSDLWTEDGSVGADDSGGTGGSATGGFGAIDGSGGDLETGGFVGVGGFFTGGSSTGGNSTGGQPPLRTSCELTGDDPRVAGIRPDEIAWLDAADFVAGDVATYHWSVQMEDCDAVVSNTEILLQGERTRIVTFQPSRPAIYHLTLDVVGKGGDTASCKLNVPVEGIGMRVELCWDTSTSTDLDLYLHNPNHQARWFSLGSSDVISGLNGATCNTSNCAAALRGLPRINWGYADSPLGACNTAAFDGFLSIGRCPNPRAADDNNQSIANGTAERMQLDNPHDGQTFRVMAQNFDNGPAQPHVFVYCGGERAGAFQAPAQPPNFMEPLPQTGFGVMWRATDVTTHVDSNGDVTCTAVPVVNGVTIDDTRY
ncbi:MAG TPA: hypothetical protein VLC09_08845 [Polyangiaceae bacterium]|nr:hypothetical protein [Polyangiaceae bacterium]